MQHVLIFTLSVLLSFPVLATDWKDYPEDLQQYDFSGDKLQQQWQDLTKLTRVEYPDVDWIRSMMTDYPRLAHHMMVLGSDPEAHPAVFKAIQESDYSDLSNAVQEVWRLHYSGQYEKAYELGMQLGPVGEVPAIYSRLVHATLLIDDHDDKMEEFEEAAALSNEGLALAPEYRFAEFGLVYAKVRMLELMSTGEARSSGYIPIAQDKLDKLQEYAPDRGAYPLTRGGLEAGIVERVGSFLGSITYGATESSAIENFEKAQKLLPDMAIVYNEYSVGLIRLDEDDFRKEIRKLLNTCMNIEPVNAEDALNQMHCQRTLKSLTKD
jgi:tetratricopeptide (TPR) repeat protein